MPTCHIHPDRETGRTCTRCGRPACPDCLVDAPVGAHCRTCVRESQPSGKQQLQRRVRSLQRDSVLVTKALIAINVVVAVLAFLKDTGGLSRSNPLALDWAVAAQPVYDGEWWRLLTAGFLHYGLLHLAFNMVALYQLGVTLEGGIGRARFLGIYLVSILAGSAGAIFFDPHALTAGASGGVFGLAAAATLGMAQRGVRFSQTGWGPILLINLFITFTIPGISVGGHLGGLAGGLVAGFLTIRPRRKPNLTLDLVALTALAAALVAAGEYFAAHPR